MSTVDEIKQKLDIVSVISDYVRLEKAGKNFRALCPFHAEKVPSFFVFPERQTWRCFGCGASGDIFSFVMRKEGLDFPGALKLLAQRAGVSLPQRKGEREERLERLYRINELAAEYYHWLLLNSPLAQAAREYVKSRALTGETVKEFQLGFSPDSWDAVKGFLIQKGYKEEELVTAGLLVEKEGRTYDRFRARLMFPIRDVKGRVSGFGARALDDSLPKYLNSPESPIFEKGSILYGIERAKAAIREQNKVVIVEGYMDVLTAHQNGFRNVVASMGTSLTERQLGILKGLTGNLCLALDADAAGNIATLRDIEVCRQALRQPVKDLSNWLGSSSELGAEIAIISLPEGKDPDQVIKENPEEWQRLVNEAQPLMEFSFALAARFDLTKPEGKSRACEQLLPLIAELRDPVERETYLSKLARLVGLSERTLAGMAARLSRSKLEKERKLESPGLVSRTGDRLEEYCLCLLFWHPELRDKAKELSPEHFERSENRELFLAWQRNPEPEAICQSLNPALHEHLQALLSRKQPPANEREKEKALNDCIRRLEERKARAQLVFEAELALQKEGNKV